MIRNSVFGAVLAIGIWGAAAAAADGPASQPGRRTWVFTGGQWGSAASEPDSRPGDEGDRVDSSTSQPVRILSATSTAPEDGDQLPEVEGMSQEMVRQVVQMAKQNAQVREAILQRYPQLAEAVLGKAPEPESRPALSTTQLAAGEDKRRKAEALVARLAGATSQDAEAIEQGLFQLGSDSMVPLKLAELSEDFELRQRAAAAAGRLRWRLVCGEALLKEQAGLIAAMSGQDAAARAAAVDKVARSAGPESVDFLGECLADPQPFVRQRAIDGLVRVCQQGGDDQALPANVRRKAVGFLESALQDDEDRNIRLLAIGAMAKIGAVNVDQLAKLLDDESLEVRATVIRAMGFSRQAKAVGYIRPLLADSQWRVRAAALEALAELVDQDKARPVAPDVMARLTDEDSYVRDLAAKILGRWRYSDSAATLLKLLQEGRLGEGAAFPALAQMRDRAGRDLLLRRYAEANDIARKVDVLTFLNEYDPDGEVDRLLEAAIRSEAMKAARARFINLASRRENRARFFVLACQYVESDQEDVAEAASEMVLDNASSYAMPPEQVSRLLDGDHVGRAVTALKAAYTYNAADFKPILLKAATHRLPEVAAQALGMIGSIYLSDSFGEDVPTYRRTESYRSSVLQVDAHPVVTERLPVDVAREVAKDLTRGDSRYLPIYAAAILYRSGADRGERVVRLLKAGLKDPEFSLRYKAMAGIVEEPRPFMAEFDVIAASRDPALMGRAIDVMAGLQDPNYAPRLMELAADMGLENRSLMRALIMSGNPKAMDLVLSKSSQASSYERESLAEQLASSPGPGPVQFLHRSLKIEKDEYYRSRLAEILVGLPDPSVKPALLELLADKKLAERGVKPRILARLAELDPSGSAERLRAILASGDQDSLESAVQGLVQAKPNRDLVAVVLEAATNEPPSGSDEGIWYPLIEWVPPDDLRAQFLSALSKLNSPAQDALLRRISRDLNEADLGPLMGASVRNAFTQMWLSALIGRLTADRPDRRPALDELSSSSAPSLAGVLIAAGDWDDAPAALAPFLEDSRPQVASAACTGLSLYLLGHPKAPLADPARRALVRTLQAKEPIPAYLAAEALGLHDRAALLQVEPNSISASTASLRLAAAFGKDVPPELQAVVRSTLTRNVGPTAIQLAAFSAAASWQDSYSLNLDPLAGRVPPERLVRLALLSKDAILLRQVFGGFVNSAMGRQVAAETRRRIVAEARKDDIRFFSHLAAIGWIEKPEPGDLARLLRAMSSSGGYDSSYAPLPDWPDQWGALPEDPEVIQLISKDKMIGVLAAATAAVQWDSNSAREVLLQAATTIPKKGSSSRQTNLPMTAVKALRLCARPADANVLAGAWKTLDPEDDSHRELRTEMLGLILAISPPDAAKLAAATAGAGNSYGMAYEMVAMLPALEILTADGNGGQEGSSYVRMSDLRWDALRELKSAATVSSTTAPAALGALSGPADRTAPASLPAPALIVPEGSSPQEWMAMAAPPWGQTAFLGFGSDLPAFCDPAPLAKGVLDQFVVLARELQQKVEKEAALRRLPGPIYEDSRSGESTASHLAEEVTARFSFSWVPEESYAGLSAVFPVGLYLPADRIATELLPLLSHESSLTRSAAMHAAAAWRVVDLSDAIVGRLDGNGLEPIEAAWALASLNGRSAVGPIAGAYDRQKDFDTRVRLACLLRMLGDDRGRAEIDRAVSLGTTRLFRLKFLSQPGPANYPRSYRGRYAPWDSPWAPSAGGEFSLRDRLLPWMPAVQMAAPERLAEAMKPFPAPPTDVADMEAEEEPPTAAPAGGIDLSSLRLNAQGRLDLHPPRGILLPLPGLSAGRQPADPRIDYESVGLWGDERFSLTFASLATAEQSLEPLCFVQFADRSVSPVDLLAKWRTWWSANKDKPRADWWRQATAQAVEELTHDRWCYRMVAARRLMRLTGRPVAIPNPFDRPAWAAIQGPWRQWLSRHEKEDPRAWLIEAAIDAKVLDAAATDGYSRSQVAWLDALVQIAGAGSHPLSSAALLQLEAWPDREQLVRRCLPWQQSRVEALRVWARRELRMLTGKLLLVFAEADLPPRAATRPAE